MNQYSVFTHCYHCPVAVKHGFNWPSLFFGPVWALCIGCWRGLALYAIAIMAHVGAFPAWMSSVPAFDKGQRIMVLLAYLVFMLALEIWMSRSTNAWHRKSLLNRGYVVADVVMAMDRPHAVGLSSLVRPIYLGVPAH